MIVCPSRLFRARLARDEVSDAGETRDAFRRNLDRSGVPAFAGTPLL